MEKPIVLSTRDCEAFDELRRDKAAIDCTLEVAITAHTNANVKLLRSHGKLWEHIREAYSLDPEKEYDCRYSPIYRRRIITESTEEDNE